MDPNGHFAISAILLGALIGAIGGATFYTAGALCEYAISGQFNWSWGGFVGGILGGALGGAFGYCVSFGENFWSGFFSSAGTMIGENIVGDANYSAVDIALVSLLNGAISVFSAGIMGKIKVPGISAGRGSFSAISKQIFTKFNRGIISKISAKTFSKMLAIEMYNGVLSFIAEQIAKVLNGEFEKG